MDVFYDSYKRKTYEWQGGSVFLWIIYFVVLMEPVTDYFILSLDKTLTTIFKHLFLVIFKSLI